MSKYTVLQDSNADATVQRILDLVCAELKGLMGETLRAIVLVGGYGRGEGGIYLLNGNYYLVNDLDLLVFVKGSLKQAKKRFEERLEHLAQGWLAEGRGLKGIDVELTHISRYRFLVPNTVSYYEVANGHQVIHGALDLDRVMPKFDPRRLPTYEGTNYFRNRGSALLIPAIYFLTDGLQDPGKRESFQIELQRACLAMGDACLLMAHQYHFSYRERLHRFRQIKKEALKIPTDLFYRVVPLYEWGMTNKLTPCFAWPGDQEMVKKWFEVREVFGDFFLWYESARLHREFSGWGEYASYVVRHGADESLNLKLRSALRTVLSFTQGREKKADDGFSPLQRKRRDLAIMSLLLFSLNTGLDVQSSLTAKAAELLGRSVSTSDLALWKDLVARYLLSSYPVPVVKDALSPLRQAGSFVG